MQQAGSSGAVAAVLPLNPDHVLPALGLGGGGAPWLTFFMSRSADVISCDAYVTFMPFCTVMGSHPVPPVFTKPKSASERSSSLVCMVARPLMVAMWRLRAGRTSGLVYAVPPRRASSLSLDRYVRKAWRASIWINSVRGGGSAEAGAPSDGGAAAAGAAMVVVVMGGGRTMRNCSPPGGGGSSILLLRKERRAVCRGASKVVRLLFQ